MYTELARELIYMKHEVTTMNTKKTLASSLKKFMEKNGYTFPVAFDGNKTVYGLFAEKYVPRNFIIERDGKIAFHTVGYTPEEFDEMVEGIAKLLEE